ncbi:MAG: bifunctional enoyl-CoA hydratase/phosphate acetyltransferase [Planctomycetota bacterium]|jgi:phosphate butyryltransferase
MKKLSEIVEAVKDYPVKRVAVAAAADLTVIEAVKAATEASVATAVLVGDEKVIRAYAEQTDLTLTKDDVVSEPVPERAALCAAQLVSTGQADVLMKGHIHTDDFLRAVLDKEVGLRTGYRMSHVFACEMPAFDRLIMVTDSSMNIAPDLEAKAEIILNADYFCEVIGISSPRVACLAAVELLNPQMPATVDATCLAKMADRNQYNPKCIVDGPFALDNALSPAAARHKGIGGPVAGQADVLLVPDIEAGNILVKSFVYAAQARVAGVVIGAKAPVVLTLRLKIGKVHY